MRKQRFHPAQIVTAALAAGFLVWFCLPGFFNAGTFLGVLLSLLIAAAALLFPHIARGVKWLWKRIPGRAALCALCAAAAAFAGYLGFCGVQMARYSSRPLEQVNAVMILGCQVHGNTPGNELVSRMESALPLIEQNPSRARDSHRRAGQRGVHSRSGRHESLACRKGRERIEDLHGNSVALNPHKFRVFRADTP